MRMSFVTAHVLMIINICRYYSSWLCITHIRGVCYLFFVRELRNDEFVCTHKLLLRVCECVCVCLHVCHCVGMFCIVRCICACTNNHQLHTNNMYVHVCMLNILVCQHP